MAQWTTVLILVFAFPCVNSSRIYQSHDSKSKSTGEGIAPDMVEALNAWYSKKTYRYVILNVPEDEADDMTGYTAPPEKTYADFVQALTSCPGPCMGVFEFSWTAPRGGGAVKLSEAGMFKWAPDDPPERYKKISMRRKYTSMMMDLTNFREPAVKKVISRWNPKVMQASEVADLSPEDIVPNLKGGRMGTSMNNLNPDGKALYDELKKEMDGGASAPIPQTAEEPVDTPVPEPKATPVSKPTWKKPSQPKPTPTQSTGAGMTSTDKAEMLTIMKHMISQEFEEKKAAIMDAAQQAAEKAVETVATKAAKEAAKEAVAAIFKDLATKI